MKLESPLAAASLPPRDGTSESTSAQAHFDAIGAICREAGVPWVLLSGGASTERFERVLDYAYAAGASGFLAGRTIWLDAIRSNFPDASKVEAALERDGVAVLERLSAFTRRKAVAWQPRYGGFEAVRQEGDFARMYGT
jgi:tagatose 1,6-diphosphate aldolase